MIEKALCPHHTITYDSPEEGAAKVRGMDVADLEHVVRCGMVQGSLLYGIAKVIAEKTYRRPKRGRRRSKLPPQSYKDFGEHTLATFSRLGVEYPQG